MPSLPEFTYHPDPLATGSIVPFGGECPSCGMARGYAYASMPYAEGEHEHICPWCIADGSANEKFDATFVDAWPLRKAKVSEVVIAEVTKRTPGYEAWQQEQWLTCCGDACEFHGDAPASELQALDEAGLSRLDSTSGFAVDLLRDMIEHYEPGGSPAFYKFTCRHCGLVLYAADCD